jgi:porin
MGQPYKAGWSTLNNGIQNLVHTILFAALLAATQALAQEDKKTDEDNPADPDTGESTVEEKTLGILPNRFQRYGIKFAANYIGETLGNISGGLKQGAIYEGRLNLAVDVDLQKLAGIDKLTFHANMFQIHGEGLSRSNLATSSSSAASKRYHPPYYMKPISRSSGETRRSL